MAFDPKQMNVDYRTIMSIPFGVRQSIFTTGILDAMSASLTPGQKASLFPNYYKQTMNVMAGQRSEAGGVPEPKFQKAADWGQKRGLKPSEEKTLRERGVDTSGTRKMAPAPTDRTPSYTKDSASKNRKEMAKSVYNAFKEAGLTDAQAKAAVAEVNRENSLNPNVMFGTHKEMSKAAEGRTNYGIFSWGDPSRVKNYKEHMMSKGIMDNKGNIIVDNSVYLKEQAKFAVDEMKTSKAGQEFLENKNPTYDQGVQLLGKHIGWDMAGKHHDAGASYGRLQEGRNLIDTALTETPTTPTQKDKQSQEAAAYVQSMSQVTDAAALADDHYGALRGSSANQISKDDPFWDTLDPELKKSRDKLVDADTGLVGRETLIAADAAAKVLRKNGYIPRPVSGGDNHSANHGRGRDANYAIDMAAAIEDESGKITPVNMGSGVPYEIKRDMAMASYLASEGTGTNSRIGFPLGDSAASMHIQQDPGMKEATWGYDSRTASGASMSRTILETTPEGQRYLADFDAVKNLDKKDKSAVFASLTGMVDQTKMAQSTVNAQELKVDTKLETSNTQPATATVTPKVSPSLQASMSLGPVTAFAGGGDIDQPHLAMPLTDKGDQSNKLIAETGPEKVTPRHKVNASEVGQQNYQMPMQPPPSKDEEIKQPMKSELPTQSTMTSGVVQRPMSTVAIDHPMIPPTARKAYADAKLEPRYNNLSPIGAVYTNHNL